MNVLAALCIGSYYILRYFTVAKIIIDHINSAWQILALMHHRLALGSKKGAYQT